MPEQNLEGYATVNTLAHYRFQKIPEDEDLSDDLAVSPVTGIFVHVSADERPIPQGRVRQCSKGVNGESR